MKKKTGRDKWTWILCGNLRTTHNYCVCRYGRLCRFGLNTDVIMKNWWYTHNFCTLNSMRQWECVARLAIANSWNEQNSCTSSFVIPIAYLDTILLICSFSHHFSISASGSFEKLIMHTKHLNFVAANNDETVPFYALQKIDEKKKHELDFIITAIA